MREQYSDLELFDRFQTETEEVLSQLVLERLFAGNTKDYHTWKNASPEVSKLLWEAKTERLKLSDFAEEFFRHLAQKLGHAMLLKKGELHRLVPYIDRATVSQEVTEKLDLLLLLFEVSTQHEETKNEDVIHE